MSLAPGLSGHSERSNFGGTAGRIREVLGLVKMIFLRFEFGIGLFVRMRVGLLLFSPLLNA